jgi:hypothetical protein
MNRRLFLAAGIAALAVGLSIPANASTVYSFISFDGPGNNGGGTTVNGINNNGDVVGFSSDNAATPTLFTNFIRNANGTFSTLAIGGDPLAMANGINNSLTVAGMNSNGTAFQLAGGVVTTLPSVNGTTVSETAFGISDGGLIVGQYTDGATGTTPGFLFNGAAFTVLNPVLNAAVTNAQGVNHSGLVTGFYSIDGVHQHGFFYNSATSQFTVAGRPQHCEPGAHAIPGHQRSRSGGGILPTTGREPARFSFQHHDADVLGPEQPCEAPLPVKQ